ncbi:histone acetyltransferase type B catalytic subunit [Strongylocentrotus purpuratus]|uniref:Histone acetyltransferase type B catalytic subunit n=1 Tax=Strongylocentrotus purpuratus TaxID=7668 RepID=A0A7M7RB01_STRPU|nr:histone acetyltransferase type B catalytic subunit [Strongylocentrotus purpuratus]|eukprot:XP_785091.3 PREDICTED: histone acetyltransferase type B catalytic subunit [Strongylocentrotus purpuratus]
MAGAVANNMDSMRSALEEFISRANDVIEMKLVRSKEDIEDSTRSFAPEFTHQIFGENETVFGYRGLKVQLYFSAARLTPYLTYTFEEKVNPKKFDGVQADPILKPIVEKLEITPMDNLDRFVASLDEDVGFQPMGDLLHSYSNTDEAHGATRHFEIYKCNVMTPGFKEFHSHLQTFLWWFVDASSYIDFDDERWMYYTIFERYPHDGTKRYSTVGYSTVYRYYAYPDKIRPRISQVLILPPFQRQGHGAQFLETMYADFRKDTEVLDITVEDPSDDFVRLRDFIDCRACAQLPSFAPENLPKGLCDAMEKEALEKLKLNKKQVRKIYEILRLKSTDYSNTEHAKAYRLDVKKRLNIPFQKQKADYEKLKKVLKPEELTAAEEGTSLEERHQTLEKWFQLLLEDYRKVLDRLSMSD